jgi:hypothetical protein
VLNIGGSGIMPDWGGGIQVPEIGASEMSIVRQYRRFIVRQIGRNLFLSFFSPNGEFKFTRESLSLAGVRFVIVERGFAEAIARLERLGLKPVHQDSVRLIFENPTPQPRASLSDHLASSELEPWDAPSLPEGAATTTDPRLISAATQAGIARQPAASTDPGTAVVEEYHHTKLRIRTANPRPAMLIVTDSWHPNWKASVDVRDAYVGWVDIGFRGVALTAGNHIVEMSYRPRTLTARVVISVFSLLTILGALLFDTLRPGKPVRV